MRIEPAVHRQPGQMTQQTSTAPPSSRSRTLLWVLALAPLAALVFALVADISPGHPHVTRMAAVAMLMAVWWMTEAIPLAATALLPLVLFPLLGIMPAKAVAPQYLNDTIFLFVGAFVVALSIQRWNLHRRIALGVLRVVGSTPARLLLGFMVATALLSMWISNTATAMMMVPIAMAVLARMQETHGEAATRRLAVGLLIGIAWGASIGGMATLIGTPPNLSFARILKTTFVDAPDISFAQWMLLAGPISLLMFGLAWVLLWAVFCRGESHSQVESRHSVIVDEYRKLGRMSREEWSVLVVFVLMALLWITRTGLDFAGIPGWVQLMQLQTTVGGKTVDLVADGTVAIGMALLLFLIPAGRNREAEAPEASTSGDGEPPTGRVMLADASVFRKLPWGIVLLFGGGFALAAGFKESGLSAAVGTALQDASSIHPLLLMLLICVVVTFLTELTSNTATTELLLPLLAAGAVAAEINPLLLMIPATISASCAFMLPVATPPNAIVFGTGRIRVAQMARVGMVLNLAGALVIAFGVWLLGNAVFGITPDLPAWATLKP